MVINGNDIFMGARVERNWQSRIQQGCDQSDGSKRAETLQKANAALESKGHNVVQSGNVNLSISQAARDLLFTEEGYEQIKNDAEDFWVRNADMQKEIANGRDTEDVFWTNTGNQWMIFSKYMHDNDFYTGMSDEEIGEIEEVLARITGGMDAVSRWQYKTGVCFSDYGYGNVMRSDEAAMELESSTKALQYFAEKYVPDDKREAFEGLVDLYHTHNMEILKDYEHPFEGVERGIAEVQSGKYPNSSLFTEKIGRDVTDEHKFTMMLIKVKHNQAEKDKYQGDLSGIFDMLKQGTEDANTIWSKLEEMYAGYTTGNSEDEALKLYTLDQAAGTFNRIRDYWGKLLVTP